jgi:hypothetical protein
MATTAPRKKSAAYEAGMREGREDKNKAPKVEVEIEAPEEEAQEGPEDEEMDGASGTAKSSRKRSAKGAKNTKAPMDAECGCGNKGRKGKAACDGSCGKAMKDGSYVMKGRNDALTPQEYLAACDLGIQGRSRTYIRARLDAAERLDLKCGNGAISEGEKCTKGAAQKVDPKQYKRGNVEPNQKAAQRLRTAGRVVGAIGGLAPLAGLARGSAGGMVAGFGAARTAFTAAGALNNFAKAQATGSKAGRERLQKEAKGQLMNAGGQLVRGAVAGAAITTLARRSRRRQTLERLYKGPSAKRDSVYASGFAPDLAQLAI